VNPLQAATAAELGTLLPAIGLFAERGWTTGHALAELRRTSDLLRSRLLAEQVSLASGTITKTGTQTL